MIAFPDMSEISKSYEPQEVEKRWYAAWLDADCFHADPGSEKPPFSIVIPPPNVTGVLHLGHVLNNTMQDTLSRRARMTGHEVLWLPGTDHAGIATQTVVERKLRKEKGLHRRDLGRDAFLHEVWKWKEEHGNIIVGQLKRLGCSCDWSRERFTMDEDYVKQVLQVFVDLYNEGLIYRGKRMVNWCPVSLTALSDEEVIMKEQEGLLYHFKVEIAEEPGTFLEIATTRPETIPGDTAIAVHPKDPRYAKYIGMHAIRPLPAELPDDQKRIPIVADDYIDMEFGTGVLKVTPGHDTADFEIGERHNLPVVEVIEADGTMNERAGEQLADLDRFEARVTAADLLKELGALVREEPYKNNVGFSERADVPIEPRLSEQWFLKYPAVPESIEAIRSGEITITPERWEKVYSHWMENIRDWCISRQLWWGHRIPAWYKKDEAGQVVETKVQIESPGSGWQQDSDVLDTWFSSWLWPFATMDDATREKFYPTTVLSTGFDILFFWVARMIMAGYRFTGRRPFEHVIIHNLVRDIQGRKMSKSLGNSPNPLGLMDKYGADGLRFGLLRIAPQGADIRFDEKQIEEGRNFANKLWNAARLRQMQGPSNPEPDLAAHELLPHEIGVVAKFDATHGKVRDAFDGFRFHEAVHALYSFFWGDYCDWFLEAAKPDVSSEDPKRKAAVLETMDHILSGFLRLLHPIMPHITEELWARLGFHAPTQSEEQSQFILFAAPPAENSLAHLPAEQINKAVTETEQLYDSVKNIRNLRAEFRIPSNKSAAAKFLPQSGQRGERDLPLLTALARLEPVEIIDADNRPGSGMPATATPIGEFYLSLEGLVDPDAERKRLSSEIEKVEKEIAKVDARLANESFISRAPAVVIEENKQRKADWITRRETLKSALENLSET